ncbi:MAG: hypothetical protein ACLR56_15145 [Oscillospiraceae bacterium]
MGRLVLKTAIWRQWGRYAEYSRLALEVVKPKTAAITADGMEGRPKKTICECTWAQPGDRIGV